MSATITPIPAGRYTLDPVHSTFGFAVKHNGVSTFRGTFEQVDAQLADGVLTGTAQVESLKIALPDLKGHLLSADFFDAEHTPTVTFRSTAIRPAEDGTVEVEGELTIRGTTKPVVATGTYAVGIGIAGSEVVGLSLTAPVDRREFGLNWQAELPSGGNVLDWQVTIEAHLELGKAE